MNVAVIGAGVSGLLTAYLINQQDPGAGVHIFDKAERVGGNADTRSVALSGGMRWADMGVNDFNLTTYKHIKQLLDKFGVAYAELENSTSFSTEDGSESYYIDADGTTTMNKKLRDEYRHFQQKAPEQILRDNSVLNQTVEHFLEIHGYSKEFGEYNLYPRINGMYFVNDTHPKDMPIKAVMDYYMLQEGFGHQDPPERVYLKEGMSSWIGELARHINAEFRMGQEVSVSAYSDGVTITGEDIHEHFDAVIMCCHADIALHTVRQGLTADMVRALSTFRYNNSLSVAHTFAPVLPPDRSVWRTYNILIHEEYEQLRPYTITYVCNRHQNDKNNPAYDRYENPEYFVTLNPHKPIPPQFVMRGYDEQPQTCYFRHNVVNGDVLRVQHNRIIETEQGKNNIYFGAGWRFGAGLHEQCFKAAEGAVTSLIHGRSDEHQQYTPGASPEEFAPQYMREIFSHFFDRSG